MPSQLNITIITNAGGSSGGTTTASIVVVPIPTALQTLDSGDSFGQGQAATQTGFSAIDQLIRSIFRAGCFRVPSGIPSVADTWYSSSAIQSISYQ
jgi:hypothetical protein